MPQAAGKGAMPKGGKGGKGLKGPSLGLRIPTKSCSGSAAGWLDTVEKFVNTPPNVDREAYFRTYGKACRHKSGTAKILAKVLEDRLGGLEYVNKEYCFNRDFLGVLRYAFQIPEGYEIRLPEAGEFIHWRGEDLWVGIPLEHFRAGLRLPMHRFFHTLFVDMRLGLGQLGPNSIRKICAFIARCTELGREPTLSLFWVLHRLQASRDYEPLFELHWKEGKALGGCLVEGPSTNKGWHVEFAFFRGGTLDICRSIVDLTGLRAALRGLSVWKRKNGKRPLGL